MGGISNGVVQIMHFGVMNNGDDTEDEDPTVEDITQQLEETNAVLKAVGDAMQRLNKMPLTDPRPSRVYVPKEKEHGNE